MNALRNAWFLLTMTLWLAAGLAFWLVAICCIAVTGACWCIGQIFNYWTNELQMTKQQELLQARSAALKTLHQYEDEFYRCDHAAKQNAALAKEMEGRAQEMAEGLKHIRATGHDIQFQLLLHLPYRRFCKLFNI